jgi:hypothetical protein
MSITTRTRRGFATAIAAVLTAGGAVALSAAPAQAAAVTTIGSNPVTDATFTWGLSDEQGGGAFFGGCNFLSAGTAGNTGSSRVWAEADGFYKATDGNVTIQKPDAAGQPVAPTWATKCQTADGTPVTANNVASKTGNQVKIAAGRGALSVADNTANIQWTGSFTSVFYGGMTYWSAANPKLVVKADGTGTITATASGYGTSREDMTQWVALPARTITLANLKNVDVTSSGLVVGGTSTPTITPDYLGVALDPGTTTTPQATTGAAWGSFPKSFVEFQQLTGQSSYWYSSGGSRDAAKPAAPLTVGLTTAGAAPTVTVSDSEIEEDGTQTVTVTGQNFDPALATGSRPPLAGKPSGVYVAFGKYADVWKPSESAASSARSNLGSATKWAALAADMTTIGGPAAGAVELKTDGSFTTELNIDKGALDTTAVAATLKNYGIYTYPGGGASQPAYETYTPITFAGTTPPVVDPPVVTPPVVTPPVAAPPAAAPAAPAAPAKVSAKRGATKKPTTTKTGRTSVVLTSANGAPVSGKIVVTFKQKGKKTKTKTVTVRNGKADVTIPKLAKGTWKVSVEYVGTKQFAKTATLSRGSFKVTR